MPTIFTRIINGEIPCYKIAEDQHFIAFLDINPLTEGHTLVVPKVEIDYIFDLEEDTLSKIMVFAKKIARAIDKAIPSLRTGIVVLGTEVPHAHVHLVPMHQGIIDFKAKKETFTPAQFAETARKITEKLT